MAETIKKIQLQRDAWKALAQEMVTFLEEGLDERTGYSEVSRGVLEAWQRRVKILGK